MAVTRVKAQQPSKIPCPLAFVGEAPSDEELEKGIPLVGPSGRVYNAILRAAGVDRDACWTGNLFEEMAPDNDVSGWMADPAIYEPAKARLMADLASVSPTVIVPMGGTALYALAGTNQITRYRGAVIQDNLGRKMVPTFHPAHVMRQWKFFPVVLGDVIKADREAKRGPKVFWPKKKLILAPSLHDIESYMPLVLASDLVSVDIETGWGQITCIGFAADAASAICIPFVDLRKPSKSYWGSVDAEVRAWGMVREMLESPVPKLGQNYGSYDAFWLMDKMGIKTRGFSEDTMLMHHALFPELPKDLGFMGATYTDQGPWKTMSPRGKKRED